jgi:hypothetical protein
MFADVVGGLRRRRGTAYQIRRVFTRSRAGVVLRRLSGERLRKRAVVGGDRSGAHAVRGKAFDGSIVEKTLEITDLAWGLPDRLGGNPQAARPRALTARGNPPLTRHKAAALSGILTGRTSHASAGGSGAIAVRRRRPSGKRAREHAVAGGEVSSFINLVSEQIVRQTV